MSTGKQRPPEVGEVSRETVAFSPQETLVSDDEEEEDTVAKPSPAARFTEDTTMPAASPLERKDQG